MYLPLSNLKLSRIDSGVTGTIFVGTEINGGHYSSSYVVVDGGEQVVGKLALGLSGNGAFHAILLSQGEKNFGLELPHADLVMLEIGDPKMSRFNGSLDVGQLLVTAQSAYLGIEWRHQLTEFAVVDLKTWTLHSYSDVNPKDGKALLVNWRLVHRHPDETIVLAEPPRLEPVKTETA
jgi:hypothetical protein